MEQKKKKRISYAYYYETRQVILFDGETLVCIHFSHTNNIDQLAAPTLNEEVLVIERKPNGDGVIRNGNTETAYRVRRAVLHTVCGAAG